MKLTTSLIGLAAALSSTTVLASTTVEYHHVLQASFVGTNHLSYQIYAGDELACSNTVDTTEFGDSTFEDQCNDDWKISLDVDAGPNSFGQISLTGKVGDVLFIEPPIDLKQDAPDMQYGCGNTLCIGIQEERSGSFEFDPQF
ncbi:hypothetical protein Q7P36_010289 [Cladosporium allicinum]